MALWINFHCAQPRGEGAPDEEQMTHALDRVIMLRGIKARLQKLQAPVIAYNELASRAVQVLFEQVHLHVTIQMAKAFTALITIRAKFTHTELPLFSRPALFASVNRTNDARHSFASRAFFSSKTARV